MPETKTHKKYHKGGLRTKEGLDPIITCPWGGKSVATVK